MHPRLGGPSKSEKSTITASTEAIYTEIPTKDGENVGYDVVYEESPSIRYDLCELEKSLTKMNSTQSVCTKIPEENLTEATYEEIHFFLDDPA